ncbi:MAG: phytanoyl-CoA dioxygenase [Phycisphaeraceae bacterium]|nr:phytanoyl-CoA dioxygenase [Phycisphaeraceae bacterium]
MSATPGTIESAHVDFYRENGYLVTEELIPMADVEMLRRETLAIYRGQGSVRGMTPVDPGESEATTLSRYFCLHFPHKISKPILDFVRHPALVEVLSAIIGPNVKCMQTMFFAKAPSGRGQAWHQDEFFIPTRDRSLCGAWVALDDVDQENGCLWVMPGSHEPGVLWPMDENRDDRISGPSRSSYGYPFPDDDAVPVEMKAGSVVFFNGYLLHRSFDNLSADRFRRALVIHTMSAESLLPADFGRRIEPTDDMRDIVMVCGDDPYAYKGVEDLIEPFLRGESPEQYREAAESST